MSRLSDVERILVFVRFQINELVAEVPALWHLILLKSNIYITNFSQCLLMQQ